MTTCVWMTDGQQLRCYVSEKGSFSGTPDGEHSIRHCTQLKFNGASSHSVLSMRTSMALISQQLYENTPPEKYATLFCSVYMITKTGRLTYTNAGHLKPFWCAIDRQLPLKATYGSRLTAEREVRTARRPPVTDGDFLLSFPMGFLRPKTTRRRSSAKVVLQKSHR